MTFGYIVIGTVIGWLVTAIFYKFFGPKVYFGVDGAVERIEHKGRTFVDAVRTRL